MRAFLDPLRSCAQAGPLSLLCELVSSLPLHRIRDGIGKDVALIQSFTGHSSINMIGRYGKASEEDKQKAIDSLFLKS
jgi:hypothetical protein